ncbi:MAG: helix-turn-helix domain-containing protein [Lachnospiraceae bacterium]
MTSQPLDFFDPDVRKIAQEDGCAVYRMHNNTGEGIITKYEVFPGITIFFNDIHMRDSSNKNKLPRDGVLEINHCREGRFECEFENGDCLYIGAGDLSLHMLSNRTSTTSFPLSHYHGVSITINIEIANDSLKAIARVFECKPVDLNKMLEVFTKDTWCVLRSQDEIEHIFSELYQVKPEQLDWYFKIKVLELLLFLSDLNISEYEEVKRYFYKDQVQQIKAIQRYMTTHLKEHITQEALSKKFNFPITSMKNCFKGVYGCSIYSYMKTYRVQAASIQLKETNLSITEIASDMGYENPSKFSEAFKKELGITPSEFRKSLSK